MSASRFAQDAGVLAVGAAVPAFTFDIDLLFVVVLPIVASWFAFVGIGVISERPLKEIGRNLLGTVMLGLVVGIVAMTAIKAMELTGEAAAFATLSIASAPVLVWKMLGQAAPGIFDAMLAAFGLQRSKRNDPEP